MLNFCKGKVRIHAQYCVLIEDDDYMPVFETVTFTPGQTTAEVEVTTVEDTTNELDEVFFAALQNPTGGAVLGASSNATIPVMDDDRKSICPSVII